MEFYSRRPGTCERTVAREGILGQQECRSCDKNFRSRLIGKSFTYTVVESSNIMVKTRLHFTVKVLPKNLVML